MYHQAMELIETNQELSLLGMILLDNDRPDKRRKQQNSYHPANNVTVPMSADLTAERQQAGVDGTQDSTAERQVDDSIHENTTQQRFPGVAQAHPSPDIQTLLAERTELLVGDSLGDILLDTLIEGVGKLYDIRCKEGCNNTYSYHHRIDELTGYTQRLAQGGNDEGKLAYLHQRKAALYGILRVVARDKETKTSQGHLPQDNGTRNNDDRQPVFHKYLGIYQHTHTDEEDSTEEILQGTDRL
jgi:hypothetical protein